MLDLSILYHQEISLQVHNFVVVIISGTKTQVSCKSNHII